MGKKRVLCQERPIITQFSDYDFSLILKNNRMSPKYERGDELFFKKARFPEWGNDFLLDTDDGAKFKRIYQAKDPKTGEDCIRCVSYNKDEFPDFLIPEKYVHGFYRCVGVLRIL
jgi:phage repressor protein C with HTH and peptisase S24 domain